MYVRKFERAANASQSPRFAQAMRIAMQALNGPQFIEDEDGRRIRLWGNGYEDWVRPDDVRAWLLGLRVVEDLRDGLEFCRQGFIEKMVKDGHLRRDRTSGFYWITAACAEKYDLPKVLGKDFPK